jgi:LPS biosynthesis protein
LQKDEIMEVEDTMLINKEGTVLRKAQIREFEILIEVDKICRKHNIQYWIDFGTLLGAIRHGGFIPWDDDLDISMLSVDYKKFLKVAPSELPDWLFLQNGKTDPSYKRKICKIRDLHSFFVERHDDFCAPYKKGIFIDIFEVIDYPNVSVGTVRFLSKWAKKTEQLYDVPQYLTAKNIIAGIFFPVVKFMIVAVWACLSVRKSNNIGYQLIHNPYNSFVSKDEVFPLGEITFEGKNFKCPHNPDACLKAYYKDYMKLPKIEDRWIHSKFIYLEEDHRIGQ